MSASSDILGPGGPFATRLRGFCARPSQQAMAAGIEAAIEDNFIFIAESGTGTGKTYAYLVPALLSGKKVLVSTGTRTLQDQLYHRDLPLVRDALRIPVTIALLKGRANYLCLHRLEEAMPPSRSSSGRLESELTRLRAWAGRTGTGDIGEISDVPENSDVWPLVTSNVDNCLGGDCPLYEECFVNRARREALAADVLVVNHHLFFADLALKEEGFGQLLPGAAAVIFDEAHQLPEVASTFFGLSVSSYQLTGLCRDTTAEELKEHSGIAGLPQAVADLEKAVADLRLAFGIEPRREPLHNMERVSEYRDAFSILKERLAHLAAALEPAATRGPGLAGCSRRAGDLLDRLFMLSEDTPADFIPWLETTARTFILHLTPVEIASQFRQRLDGDARTWIFTSATLAINGSFEHFQRRMGLEHAQTAVWESPFDYANQTLMYLPGGLPPPSAPDYTARVIENVLPVLQASGGRAFLLFTSHRALKSAADLLRGRLDYLLLVQGSMPRSELLDRFRKEGNAVLLGTGSFWEGVDVRGEALSCVMIDKLPFASPDDPVLQARGAALEQAGRNPFMEFQLPDAVIALKQGAGRLIRDQRDRGVLMLCDPRLLTRNYGAVFLKSLPPMPRTQNLEDVLAFFNGEKAGVAAEIEMNIILNRQGARVARVARKSDS